MMNNSKNPFLTFKNKTSISKKQPRTTSFSYLTPPPEPVRKMDPSKANLLLLGSPYHEYSSKETLSRKNKWARLIAVFFTLTFGIGLIIGIYGSLIHGRIVAVTWSTPYLSVAGILLAIWFVVQSTTRYRKVLFHQQGISLWDSNRINHAIRWSEIAGIVFLQEERFLLWRRLRSARCVLYPSYGKPIQLDHYCPPKELPELVTRIKANIYPVIEPQLRKSLWEKRAVYFGDVVVSSSCLTVEGVNIPWYSVKAFDIQNGCLKIILNEQGNKIISLRKIPNIELLFPILQIAREINNIEK
jgi:hypothetical protein